MNLYDTIQLNTSAMAYIVKPLFLYNDGFDIK